MTEACSLVLFDASYRAINADLFTSAAAAGMFNVKLVPPGQRTRILEADLSNARTCTALSWDQ